MLLAVQLSPARADRDDGASSAARDAVQRDVAAIEQLLSKVKAEHPGASILKLELRTRDLEGRQLTYELKLLQSDGRVVRLVYDAQTLALVRAEGAEPAHGQHQRRERRRGGR